VEAVSIPFFPFISFLFFSFRPESVVLIRALSFKGNDSVDQGGFVFLHLAILPAHLLTSLLPPPFCTAQRSSGSSLRRRSSLREARSPVQKAVARQLELGLWRWMRRSVLLDPKRYMILECRDDGTRTPSFVRRSESHTLTTSLPSATLMMCLFVPLPLPLSLSSSLFQLILSPSPCTAPDQPVRTEGGLFHVFCKLEHG
jgi:hypothetical protein